MTATVRACWHYAHSFLFKQHLVYRNRKINKSNNFQRNAKRAKI